MLYQSTMRTCMAKLCVHCSNGVPLVGRMHEIQEKNWIVKMPCPSYKLKDLVNEPDKEEVILGALSQIQQQLNALSHPISGVVTCKQQVNQLINWIKGEVESPFVHKTLPEVITSCCSCFSQSTKQCQEET